MGSGDQRMFTCLSFILCLALTACPPPRPQIESHTQNLPFEPEMATQLLRILALHEDCIHARTVSSHDHFLLPTVSISNWKADTMTVLQIRLSCHLHVYVVQLCTTLPLFHLKSLI